MANVSKRVVTALAILPALSGCSSIFGPSFFGHHNRAAISGIEQVNPESSEISTEEGRRQLAGGNPGLAIDAFRRAMANGERIGPAANGLGVAYARLGRPDLAKRSFAQAIASSPDNSKYVANLERLITANQLNFGYQDAVAAARLAAASEAAEREAQTLAQAASKNPELTSDGAMRRVSRREVMITTASPNKSARSERTVSAEPEFTPVVRLKIGRDNIPDFHPIVTIRLPESRPVTPRRDRAANGKAG